MILQHTYLAKGITCLQSYSIINLKWQEKNNYMYNSISRDTKQNLISASNRMNSIGFALAQIRTTNWWVNVKGRLPGWWRRSQQFKRESWWLHSGSTCLTNAQLGHAHNLIHIDRLLWKDWCWLQNLMGLCHSITLHRVDHSWRRPKGERHWHKRWVERNHWYW